MIDAVALLREHQKSLEFRYKQHFRDAQDSRLKAELLQTEWLDLDILIDKLEKEAASADQS